MAAISCASIRKHMEITILEQGKDVLEKVRISGGGRCNVTHACFDVKQLVNFYPRGSKELLSPFYQFNCEDAMIFFEKRNVPLKIENDGRVFPVTNDSMSIVNCLKNEAAKLGIKVLNKSKVIQIEKKDRFIVRCADKEHQADYILLASGSNATLWNIMKTFGHTIIDPVPSLFSFNTKHNLFRNLSGISIPNATVKIKDSVVESDGIILITHTGISGPAVLKLSAYGARLLAEKKYQFSILINWVNQSKMQFLEELNQIKNNYPKKAVVNYAPCQLVSRFWSNCLTELELDHSKQWANLNKKELQAIADLLCQSEIQIFSKSTNKEEFVTAGGIPLKEVDLKTMQSKVVPGMYFAGEVLDIDAVTGGFNFQAAWTTGYIAGVNIGK